MKLARLSAAGALVSLLAAVTLPAQAIVGGVATPNFMAVGIGVQVAPDWVMTVRHAIIGVGGTYENGYGMRTVAAVYVPNDAEFPGDDFALLRLVPSGASGFYPAVASEVFRPGGFRPQDVSIVSTVHQSPRGVGLTRVVEAIPTYDDDGPDGPLPAVSVNWLVSYDPNVRVENGDSGGGLFLGHVRDSSVLLGLTSALITADDGSIGSAFVQPAAYRAWIDTVMRADLVDDQMLNWVSAVPEPATWLLWTAGVALLVTRRRP